MLREAIVVIACIGISGCGVPENQQCTDPPCNVGPDGGAGDDDPVDAGVDAAPPVCANGIQDPGESDIDCGGTCNKCAGGRHCTMAADCFNGNCVAGVCSSLSTVSFAGAVYYWSGYKPYVMLAGDLDGDGDIDVAAANEAESSVSLFRNTGTSSAMFDIIPSSTGGGFPTGDYPTGGAIADFNRDGIPDIITADYHGNSVSILMGSGTGTSYTLTANANYPTVTGAETSNLAVGDLNGDSVLDVIATNPQAPSVSVFLGRNDGTLAPQVTVPLGAPSTSEPYSVAIGDFDKNGTADAAIADNRSSTVYILLGNGDGTFHSGPSQPAINGEASFILIARDMDLDGNLDLVVANRSSDDVSVLLGHGNGMFDAGIASSTGSDTGPYSLAVADFNLDGVPDVVTADYKTSTASVLLGRGNGRFDAPIDAGMTGMFSYGVAAGDFNGDGKPDFAIANALSNDIAIKLNTAQ